MAALRDGLRTDGKRLSPGSFGGVACSRLAHPSRTVKQPRCREACPRREFRMDVRVPTERPDPVQFGAMETLLRMRDAGTLRVETAVDHSAIPVIATHLGSPKKRKPHKAH
jgi:hypothetical protein